MAAQAKEWNIYNRSTGTVMVAFDSILDFSVDISSSVVSEIIEPNSFTSYNKAIHPITIDATVVIQGDVSTRQSAMDTLMSLRTSLKLFSFVTPEYEFRNLNLESFEQPQRSSTQGANILIVALHMKEVRSGSSGSTSNANAEDSSKTTIGTVSKVSSGTDAVSAAAKG